jgi:hypothetical protein
MISETWHAAFLITLWLASMAYGAGVIARLLA